METRRVDIVAEADAGTEALTVAGAAKVPGGMLAVLLMGVDGASMIFCLTPSPSVIHVHPSSTASHGFVDVLETGESSRGWTAPGTTALS